MRNRIIRLMSIQNDTRSRYSFWRTPKTMSTLLWGSITVAFGGSFRLYHELSFSKRTRLTRIADVAAMQTSIKIVKRIRLRNTSLVGLLLLTTALIAAPLLHAQAPA